MKLERANSAEDVTYSQGIESGDYVPHFYIDNDGHKLDIQARSGDYLLLGFLDGRMKSETLRRYLDADMPMRTYFVTDRPQAISASRLFVDANLYRIFRQENASAAFYLCDPNLKVVRVYRGNDPGELIKQLPAPGDLRRPANWLPILVVPNVISPDLAERLMGYFDAHSGRAETNSGDYKSRAHLHPSAELSRELDNKLCKSLLPEIKKVYYSDITHRETYKICCYASSEAGTFGKHRDTIDPHLHRRYAMTLVLNDNYRSGGIRFPEYNDAVFPATRCSAIIFPGSLYHEVTKVRGGKRYVLISFLFTEAEARLKANSEDWRFSVNRDLRGLQINRLQPLSER